MIVKVTLFIEVEDMDKDEVLEDVIFFVEDLGDYIVGLGLSEIVEDEEDADEDEITL